MNRLRGQKDFDRVRRAGRAWSHPLLVLNVVQNEQAFSRYGFIASKSVGNAVARNRAKRLLREAMRQRHDGIEESWDLVLIARKQMKGVRLEQVQAALDELLERAKFNQEPKA